MSDQADVRDSLTRFIKTRKDPHPLVCTVDSIDDTDPKFPTCYCIPINGDADIIGVRLIVVSSVGFLIRPKLNSQVLVSFIDSDNAYVALFSQTDEIDLNGKSYGGLTKTEELKTQLDKVNTQLQAVINALSTWTVVANDGGAALKAFFLTQISGKPVGDFSDIESSKVFHGDGT